MAVSKGTFNNRHGLLVLILFAMMAVLSFYLFQHAFSFRYVQIDLLIGAVGLSFLFLLIILTSMQDFKAIDVYEEQIKVNWLWRLYSRRINKADITLFAQTAKKNINYIVIRTAKTDYILPEQLISNSEELLLQLKHWKVKQKNNILFIRRSRFENKGMGVFFMAFGTFLLGFTLKAAISIDSSIDGSQLITIGGHLSMPADIHQPSGKSSSGYVHLYLTEYPGINFEIDRVGYNIIHVNEMKKYNRETTVELSIPRREYLVKIMKTEEPGYFEKHLEWTTIYTYSVLLDDKQVYNVDTYNESQQALHNSNKKWSILIAVIAILLFAYGWRLYKQPMPLNET